MLARRHPPELFGYSAGPFVPPGAPPGPAHCLREHRQPQRLGHTPEVPWLVSFHPEENKFPCSETALPCVPK